MEKKLISDTQVRVKMYKAGKNWVSILISKWKMIKQGGQTITLKKRESSIDSAELSLQNRQYIKALLLAGTVSGGALISNAVVQADETTVATDTTNASSNTDVVIVSTTETASTSSTGSTSTSVTSESQSSTSQSLSDGQESQTLSTTSTDTRSQTSESLSKTSEGSSTSISASESTSEVTPRMVRSRVYVRAAATTPTDVTSQLTNVAISFNDSQNVNPGTINMGTGEHLYLETSFQIASARANDTFSIKLSDNLDINGVGTSLTVEQIQSNGETLATGVYDPDTHTIKYTFTSDIINVTKASVTNPIWPDDRLIPNTTSGQTFTASVGTTSQSITENISYGTETTTKVGNQDLQINSRIVQQDETTQTVTYNTLVNPNGNNLTTSYHYYSEITNVTNTDDGTGHIITSTVNLRDATVQIYRGTTTTIGQSINPDLSTLTDVTDVYSHTVDQYGNIVIDWGNNAFSDTNNNVYMIVVKASYNNTEDIGLVSSLETIVLNRYKFAAYHGAYVRDATGKSAFESEKTAESLSVSSSESLSLHDQSLSESNSISLVAHDQSVSQSESVSLSEYTQSVSASLSTEQSEHEASVNASISESLSQHDQSVSLSTSESISNFEVSVSTSESLADSEYYQSVVTSVSASASLKE
ncbi:KxYKxGKxW signal peptide [Streptococcus urinalis FB127-CNA-2]|uniref:Fibrinogen-binding adhesin C-terminal domain protein n=1 Tax=Streptococcus urinalis 2285-97 TaxID=764291 RepID=G5KI16_9STRE|nr:Ig-like domain-containing protein [Streptococcus urinalis]EHJ56635.1 fibrinogen-binding adhesin C-terminal domain protein [Streptococcus urinalis 2285-97]EKS20504.1 KxYKxGKxW signal peptide [Streptococcus urinalis FB127-CNA-2]VEF31197.1 cell wall surface anchor family protein [Streptococcus urinalis]